MAYICVTHCVSHNVEYLIGLRYAQTSKQSARKVLSKTFFHPNFRVSFLHKLHPPWCLTQFRVAHSDFYKPRRANGALAIFFFRTFFRTNFRVGVLHKLHPFVSHTIRISHYPHLVFISPDAQRERSQMFCQTFFRPNPRVGLLHKLHPLLCLTQVE